MKKYLFAFDLDGTLLNDQGMLTHITIQGMKRIKELGHEMCVITGRTWSMAKKIYETSGLETPIGLYNGGVIRKGKDKTFKDFINSLNTERVMTLLKDELFLEITDSYTIETFDDSYVNDINSGSANLQRLWGDREPTLISKDHEYKDIIAVLGEMKTRSRTEAKILCDKLSLKYPHFEISFWYSKFTNRLTLEVTRETSRKDYALRMLSRHLDVKLKDTIAFGDGYNDVEMLKTAGFGVAMKNASKIVKRSAKGCTEYANEQNGVMEYIFNKILNNK